MVNMKRPKIDITEVKSVDFNLKYCRSQISTSLKPNFSNTRRRDFVHRSLTVSVLNVGQDTLKSRVLIPQKTLSPPILDPYGIFPFSLLQI